MKIALSIATLCLLTVLQAGAESAAERLVNATFKVFNTASTATGFLVRDPTPNTPRTRVVLVTANHTFVKAAGDHVLLVCRVKDEKGAWQRLDHKVLIRKDGNDLWTSHPSQDVAAIRCELPPQAVFEALPLKAIADETTIREAGLGVGDTIFYCSYPYRTEANPAGFPLLRTGVVSGYPLFPVADYPAVLFTGATFSGDSGAPIAWVANRGGPLNGTLLVAGLIVTRTQQNDRLTSDEWDITFKRDMDLGSFVHAAYIVECLDMLGR